MSKTLRIQTKNLTLVLQTRTDCLAQIEQLSPEHRAGVSTEWLEKLQGSRPADPWIHGFKLEHQVSGKRIGQCGYKGPPVGGVVEIAYAVEAAHQGKGYATEAARALTNYALGTGQVTLVCAHTLPEPNASTRVLTKCGFRKVGEVVDPEDGLVWRWELS